MIACKRYVFLLLVLTVLCAAGCGSKSTMESFLRDEVDLTHVLKVAVAPFENNSKEPYAPERVRGMAITEILAQGLYDVVDKSLVDSAFREEAVDLTKAPMDAGVIKRLGQRLNVQALMMGSIDQAGVVQRGQNSYPELGLTLRLIDVNTGMIFWQASGNESGNSLGKRLFGIGSDDEFKVSLRLLRRLLSTISSDRKVRLPSAVTAVPAQVVPVEEEKTPEKEVVPQEEEMMPQEEEVAPPAESGQDEEDQVAPMGEDESLEESLPAEETVAPPAEAPAAEEEVEKSAEQVAPSASDEESLPPLQLDQAWPE